MIENSHKQVVDFTWGNDPQASTGKRWTFRFDDGSVETVHDPQQAEQIMRAHNIRPAERFTL